MSYKKDSLNSTAKLYKKPIPNRLTLQDLQKLDSELQKYFVIKHVTYPIPQDIKILDEHRWLVDRRAITESGSIIMQKFSSAKYDSSGKCLQYADCMPILWEQLQEDLEQWRKWKYRDETKELGIVSGLEELANTLKFH